MISSTPPPPPPCVGKILNFLHVKVVVLKILEYSFKNVEFFSTEYFG